MEGVALGLILPLIGGFLYVNGCLTLKYRVARHDGHRFYFAVAYYGLCLLLIGACATAVLHISFRESGWYQLAYGAAMRTVRSMHDGEEAARMTLALLSAGLLSVALGRALPFADNKIKDEIDAMVDAIEGNDLEHLLFHALVEKKPVSVTLTSNKVYVGLILSTPDPSADRKAIGLLPLMSGYRTESGKVVFTNFYDEIYKSNPDNADEDHFKLILFIEKLTSISLFDANVYARFNAIAARVPERRRVKVRQSSGR